MPRLHEINDLYFTEAGDFFVSAQGDLLDTKYDSYRGMIQRIDTRIKSAKNSWDLQPNIGASLTDFLGKRSSSELGRTIKQRLYNELYQDDLLRSGELTVDVFPATATQLGIAIIIKPPGVTGQITRMYTYSLSDNQIFIRSF